MPVRPSANLALLSLLATPSLTTNPAHKRLSPPPPLLPPLPSTLSPPRSTPPQCTSCHPSARHAGAAQRQPCPAFAPFYAVARLGPTVQRFLPTYHTPNRSLCGTPPAPTDPRRRRTLTLPNTNTPARPVRSHPPVHRTLVVRLFPPDNMDPAYHLQTRPKTPNRVCTPWVK